MVAHLHKKLAIPCMQLLDMYIWKAVSVTGSGCLILDQANRGQT
jgi:hypothetical protein